jgi:tRNA pseudouridine32 synthase/23S rRNA pseudouridine746 synthase/23S rRNA pseudouridine1911/1915/1917 synthase
MQKLLDALIKLYPDSSRNTLKGWVEEKRVLVDGKAAKRIDDEIPDDAKIEVGKKERVVTGGLKIYFSDHDIVVIEKPCGLLSVKAAFEGERTAHGLLKEAFYPKKIFVIHRLDQDTSGVMLFGLSERSFEPLKEQFKEHTVERRYTAVVEGALKGEGTWISRLEEDAAYKMHVVEEGGEEAITHFRALKEGNGYTLIECQLETGKKNQIRVQAREASHPVVGDEKYGAETNPIKRLALHATHLSFNHPIKGKPLSFFSPPPESFTRLVRRRK